MNKSKWSLMGLVFVLALGYWALGSDWRRLIVAAPTDANVLFWNTEQRDAGFRMVDRVPFLVKSRKIKTAEPTWQLQKGEELNLDFDLDAYIEQNRASAIVVLQNGKIRLERYNLDFNKHGRWTSFSCLLYTSPSPRD